ncbi:hypothetical protein [Nonomuraea sp. NPDC050643]|uniref:MmyB family transcriptional regulator n=1 Tax=Nonomuraea sp. NPDC050643 TaxID=3155660 RepID=UPI003408BEF4
MGAGRGRYRGDAGLAAHVERLRELSADFARLWAEHPVARIRSRVYVLHHPVAGELTLHGELVALPEGPSCCGLDLSAAEPGPSSEQALRRLGGGWPMGGSAAVVVCPPPEPVPRRAGKRRGWVRSRGVRRGRP